MRNRRTDTLTAQQVDVGTTFQTILGTPDAAAYLEQQGVPLAVIVRVLFGRRSDARALPQIRRTDRS